MLSKPVTILKSLQWLDPDYNISGTIKWRYTSTYLCNNRVVILLSTYFKREQGTVIGLDNVVTMFTLLNVDIVFKASASSQD